MERVYQGSVIVRLVGKEMIAASLISKYINVFLRVPIMALMTWRQDHVYVTVTGLEWIVLKVHISNLVISASGKLIVSTHIDARYRVGYF